MKFTCSIPHIVTNATCKWLFIAIALTLLSACSAATAEPPKLLSLATIAPGTKGAQIATESATEFATDASAEGATGIPVAESATESTPDLALPTASAEPVVTADATLKATWLPTFTASSTFTPSPTRPSPTPSATQRPTRTRTPTPPAQTYTPQPCPIAWFFTPRPAECPLSKESMGSAVFQKFEHGLMIWIGSQNTIFVLYDTPKRPRWQQFTDAFTEGMPSDDPSIVPPGGMLQPIRGFGLVWRGKPGVRTRLGWATGPETPYSAGFQIDTLGNRYVQSLTTEIYKLTSDLSNWQVVH
ncbi:MAG: hypothetical protein ABI947_19835 [Chloroflexota bacterium]